MIKKITNSFDVVSNTNRTFLPQKTCNF